MDLTPFSLEPDELKAHIDFLTAAVSNPSISSSSITCSHQSELGTASLKFSRSIYAKVDINKVMSRPC